MINLYIVIYPDRLTFEIATQKVTFLHNGTIADVQRIIAEESAKQEWYYDHRHIGLSMP
jgi:hypothetical protein